MGPALASAFRYVDEKVLRAAQHQHVQPSVKKYNQCVRKLENELKAERAFIAGDTSGVGPALASAFRTVDEKVLRAARQDGKDYGSTATVALCFAAHRSLFVAHVGDSRSVLSRCPPG